MSVERIDIVITENGSRVVSRNIKEIGDTAKSTGSILNELKGILAGLGLALGVRELIDYIDTYQRIAQKLTTVTEGHANLSRVMHEVFDIANRTYQPVEETAAAYQRMAIATQHLGTAQADVLRMTETLSKAVALSGVTAQTAKAGLYQLAEGMEADRLQGQHLRAMISDLPLLARKLADAMGTNLAGLREMGKTGKLTAEVLQQAIMKIGPEVDTMFAKLNPTIAQTFTVLKNKVTEFIGGAGEMSGVSRVIGQGILFIADNIGTVIKAILAFGAAYSVVLGAQFIATLARASAALIAFALSNPFTAILAAISGIIAAMYLFGDTVEIVKGSGITLQDYMVGAFSMISTYAGQAWTAIKSGASEAYDVASGLWAQYGPTISSYLSEAWNAYKAYANTIIGIAVGYYNAIVGLWQAYGPAIMSFIEPVFKWFGEMWNNLVGWAKSAYDYIIANWSSWASTMGGYLETYVSIVKGVWNTIIGGFVGVYGAIVAAFEGLPAAMGDIAYRAANALIEPIQRGINKIISGLNSIGAGLTPLSESGVGNPFAGAADNLGKDVAKSFSESLSRDYVGAVGDSVKKAVTESTAGKIIAGSFTDALGKDYVGGVADAAKKTSAGVVNELNAAAAKAALDRKNREAVGDLIGKRDPTHNPNDLNAGKKTGKEKEEKDAFLEAQKKLLKEIKEPMDNYLLNMRALDQLMKDGKITNEEYQKSWEKIRLKLLETQTDAFSGIERGLIKIHQEATNSAKLIEDALTNAFKKAEDAFIDFIKTGKVDFKSFVSSIIEDLARIAWKQSITAPLSGFLSNLFGGAGSSGTSSFASVGSSLLGGIKSLFGFATGGSFTVGGSGGVDSQMVAFPASPGETVSIARPGQSGGANSQQVINFNITTPNPTAFKQSESQIAARMQRLAARANRVS